MNLSQFFLLSSKSDSSHPNNLTRWGTTRLRLLFLLPMGVAIAIIIFVLSMMLYQHTHYNLEKDVIKIRASVKDIYHESIKYDTNVLHTIMNIITNNKNLSLALSERNRDMLLKHASPLYEDIRRNYNITHFYFTGIDRVNILRVHAPLRYGDTINRITTLQAEHSGTVAHGVELGPLGTFTLRLVSPWYDPKTNNLLGYVELGIEIDHIINKLEKLFNVHVVAMIKKEFLNRDKWESGMHTLGRTPHWDRYQDKIVSNGQSDHTIYSLLAKRLTERELIANKSILEMTYQNISYRVTVLPLFDAGGNSVAEMILLANVTENENYARHTVHLGISTLLTVGGILFIFFYWLVGRIGRHIEHSEIALHDLATHDGLTGLYNHRTFYTILNDRIKHANRYKHNVSLIMLDIDHFKGVNDTYGHQAGDRILRGLSDRLMERVRSTDSVCRYGGEEIMVILPETELHHAQEIAEDLRLLIEKDTFDIGNDQNINITVSIGVTTYPEHAKEIPSLVSHADTALYHAKKSGRNQVCMYKKN